MTDERPPAHRVAGNTAFLGAAGIAGRIIHFGLLLYLGNEMSRSDFGVLGFCLNVAMIFSVFADFGLEPLATLVIARNKTALKILTGRLLRLRSITIGLAAVGMAVMTAALVGLGRAPSESVVAVILMAAMSLLAFVRVLFRGIERMEFEALLGFGEKILLVLFSFLHLKLVPWPPLPGASGSPAAYQVLLAFIEADVIVSAAGLWLAARIAARRSESSVTDLGPVQDRTVADLGSFRRFLDHVWPYGLGALCVALFFRIDTILLQVLRGEDAVGDYRYAFTLFEILFLLPQTVSLAVYPAVAAMSGRGEDTSPLLGGLTRLYGLISLPLAVGGWIVGPKLVTLCFSQSRSAPEIWLNLVWALPFVYGNFLFGTALTASGHQRANLTVSAAVTIIGVLLYLCLIPVLGAVGAGLAAAMNQALYCVLLAQACRRAGVRVLLGRNLIRLLIPTLAMALVVYPLRDQPLGLSIGLGALVYIATAILSGSVSLAEVTSLAGFLKAGRREPGSGAPAFLTGEADRSKSGARG